MNALITKASKTPVALEIDFTYKGISYHINGTVTKDRDRANNEQLGFVFQAPEDPFPCAMLDYNITKRIFNVYKLRALPWKAAAGEERIKCLEPSLPAKGALDILVFMSLAIAEEIDPEARVKIKDDARIENNKVLSWLKYFAVGQTAYSKYGFILRERDLQLPPEEQIQHFKQFMAEEMPERLKLKLHEAVDKRNIRALESAAKELDPKKRIGPNFSLERIIHDWIDTEHLGEILDIMKKNIHIDLRGIWYLSWTYYRGLRNEERATITSLKISS